MPEAPQLSVSGLNHLTLAVAELDRSLALLHAGSLATRLKALEQNPYDEMKYRWRS